MQELFATFVDYKHRCGERERVRQRQTEIRDYKLCFKWKVPEKKSNYLKNLWFYFFVNPER